MKSIFRKFAAAFAVIASLFVAAPALAWDGNHSGTITDIQVTDTGNFGVRVNLTSGAGCTGSSYGFSYMDETDSNFKTYLAALLTAKALGSTVVIYANNVNGFCHIGYLVVY